MFDSRYATSTSTSDLSIRLCKVLHKPAINNVCVYSSNYDAREYNVVRFVSTQHPRQALALQHRGLIHFAPSLNVNQCISTGCAAWNALCGFVLRPIDPPEQPLQLLS